MIKTYLNSVWSNVWISFSLISHSFLNLEHSFGKKFQRFCRAFVVLFTPKASIYETISFLSFKLFIFVLIYDISGNIDISLNIILCVLFRSYIITLHFMNFFLERKILCECPINLKLHDHIIIISNTFFESNLNNSNIYHILFFKLVFSSDQDFWNCGSMTDNQIVSKKSF